MHVTLKYTKTTDSANSYNYANENDYSTSEKIIGTWIDGKTLYQRTYSGDCPTTANVITNLISISSSIKIRDMQGIIYKDSANVVVSINYSVPRTGSTYEPLTAYATTYLQDGYIKMVIGSVLTAASPQYLITIKYTKS